MFVPKRNDLVRPLASKTNKRKCIAVNVGRSLLHHVAPASPTKMASLQSGSASCSQSVASKVSRLEEGISWCSRSRSWTAGVTSLTASGHRQSDGDSGQPRSNTGVSETGRRRGTSDMTGTGKRGGGGCNIGRSKDLRRAREQTFRQRTARKDSRITFHITIRVFGDASTANVIRAPSPESTKYSIRTPQTRGHNTAGHCRVHGESSTSPPHSQHEVAHSGPCEGHWAVTHRLYAGLYAEQHSVQRPREPHRRQISGRTVGASPHAAPTLIWRAPDCQLADHWRLTGRYENSS